MSQQYRIVNNDSPKKQSVIRRRISKKRIALRFFAALFSLVFFISAMGLLYVESILSSIERPDDGEDSDWTSTTVSEPESFIDIPLTDKLIDDTNQKEVSEAMASGLTKSEAIKAVKTKFTTHKANYEKVQSIAVLDDPDIQNILLIGSDSGGLGDATILASINNKTGKIHLTSFMRAMYVNIPNRGWFMLNRAYSWGGAALVAQTLEQNFRVKIDDYIVVNFNSFPAAINAVGGVTINLTQAEAQYFADHLGQTMQVGTQWVDGETALNYARIRKIDSDFKRTERQRNIITALIHQVTNCSLGQLNDLAVTLASMVKTNLSNNDLLSLVAKAGTYASYSISQMMVPNENDTSGGKQSTYYGITYVPYYSNPSMSVEVYLFDYVGNVNTMQSFIRS